MKLWMVRLDDFLERDYRALIYDKKGNRICGAW